MTESDEFIDGLAHGIFFTVLFFILAGSLYVAIGRVI
jgi:hypothetical protein